MGWNHQLRLLRNTSISAKRKRRLMEGSCEADDNRWEVSCSCLVHLVQLSKVCQIPRRTGLLLFRTSIQSILALFRLNFRWFTSSNHVVMVSYASPICMLHICNTYTPLEDLGVFGWMNWRIHWKNWQFAAFRIRKKLQHLLAEATCDPTCFESSGGVHSTKNFSLKILVGSKRPKESRMQMKWACNKWAQGLPLIWVFAKIMVPPNHPY